MYGQKENQSSRKHNIPKIQSNKSRPNKTNKLKIFPQALNSGHLVPLQSIIKLLVSDELIPDWKPI